MFTEVESAFSTIQWPVVRRHAHGHCSQVRFRQLQPPAADPTPTRPQL